MRGPGEIRPRRGPAAEALLAVRAAPARRRRLARAGLVGLALAAGAGAGCGKKGNPLPPEPRGPLPPTQVAARQIGERYVVSLVVPQPRGSRPGQQPERVEVLRVDYRPGDTPPPDPGALRRRGVPVATLTSQTLGPGQRLRLEDSMAPAAGEDRVGWTLRYAVRVLDRRGRPSPLVVAKDLVVVAPPPPPSGLTAEATGDGVRLRWRPPAADPRARYNVYRALAGEPFGPRPLNAAPLALPELLDSEVRVGSTYVYEVRVTVADAAPYRESEPAPSVRVRAEDRFAPAAPEGLVVVQEATAARLFWNPNRERDLSGYRIYRRAEDGTWARIGPEPVLQPLYLDRDVRPGARLAYRVTAVDRADPPNESVPSAVVELDVAAEPADGGGG